MPPWGWSVVVVGVLAYAIYQIIKASELVAGHFGRLGRAIHERAKAPLRVAERVEYIADQLECATTYLALDAEYHHEEDIILAENAPGVIKLLPKRMPFTDFSRLWKTGWRPQNGFNL